MRLPWEFRTDKMSRIPVAFIHGDTYDVPMITRHVELMDCFAHLQDPLFAGCLPGVIERAAKTGVAHVVCPSGAQNEWSGLMDLSFKYNMIIPCFGLHARTMACRSEDWRHRLSTFLKISASAVGLIGLDYSLRAGDRDSQQQLFIEQLHLARQFERPVLFQCHRAWDDLIAILNDLDALPPGLLVHNYHGPIHRIEALVGKGVYFCFPGTMLLDRSRRLERMLKLIPLDRLLVSTDSPQSAPPAAYGPYQRILEHGKTVNEPANLPHLLPGVARTLQIDPERLAEVINHNSLCLFGALIRTESKA
jgi:TatD DNase family protein